jgi:SAM-dependent methyltransferase
MIVADAALASTSVVLESDVLKPIEAAGAALASRYEPSPRYSREALESSFRLSLKHLSAHAPLVLDIGAGTGVPGAILRTLIPAARLIAVDRSDAMLQVCRDTAIYDAHYCADAAALPFGNETVDFAFAVQALHLVPDKQATLVEISRTLKSTGVVLLATNTPANLRRQLFHRLLPRFSAVDVPRHFDARDVAEWAASASLRLIDSAECEFSVEFPTPADFVTFAESRPFFSQQQMSDRDFALDLETLYSVMSADLPEGVVRSNSALTAFLLVKESV